jgi:hypothetical protein
MRDFPSTSAIDLKIPSAWRRDLTGISDHIAAPTLISCHAFDCDRRRRTPPRLQEPNPGTRRGSSRLKRAGF